VKRAEKDGKMGEFQWMNAPAAAEKRLSLVLNARGQEKDLRDFSPKNARNALGRESALVPSVAAPASFKLRHNSEIRMRSHLNTAALERASTSFCPNGLTI
jgi:hypothetical protein